MTLDEFRQSAHATAPPEGLRDALEALWWDLKGDWDKSHDVASADDGRDAAWVHAYLHRREGDLGNAGYWYRRAGRPVASGDLGQERDAMVAALLSV